VVVKHWQKSKPITKTKTATYSKELWTFFLQQNRLVFSYKYYSTKNNLGGFFGDFLARRSRARKNQPKNPPKLFSNLNISVGL
jgi:hypothetical protein